MLERRGLIAALATLALVAVTAGGSLGQDDPDASKASWFLYGIGPAHRTTELVEPVLAGREGAWLEAEGWLVADDPRATGRITTIVYEDGLELDPPGRWATILTRTHRVVNEGGHWHGSGRRLSVLVEDGEGTGLGAFDGYGADLTVLTGEGGYDGLRLVLAEAWSNDGGARWGAIVPASSWPAYPELPPD